MPPKLPKSPPQPVLSDEVIAGVATQLIPRAPVGKRGLNLRARVLARIAAEGSPASAEDSAPFSQQVLRAGAGAWTEVPARPGLSQQVLHDDGVCMTRLLRFAPGACLAGHAHEYDESALVVSGWCYAGEFRLEVGDYYNVPAGARHGEIRSPAGCTLYLRGPSPTLGGNRYQAVAR